MSPRPRRPFLLGDAMILIVAIAVGSLMCRAYMPSFERSMLHVRRASGEESMLPWAFGPPLCFVVPLMIALIPISLRSPRPRLRVLARRPGFVACVAAAVSLVPGVVVWWWWPKPTLGKFLRKPMVLGGWTLAMEMTSATVLGAWLVLGMGRRWRAEAHWIDRCGRVLGLYCVLYPLHRVALFVLICLCWPLLRCLSWFFGLWPRLLSWWFDLPG